MPPLHQSEFEPLWREEVPVLEADDRYVSRRQLTKFLTLTSLGMFIGNVWIAFRSWLYHTPSYPVRSVAQLDELPLGGVKIFQYPTRNDDCILVRRSDDEYVAYSQKCTHLSCAVYYERGTDRLACPCHQGFFSARDGSVLQGPPPRPLPRVILKRQGPELIAVGIQPGKEV